MWTHPRKIHFCRRTLRLRRQRPVPRIVAGFPVNVEAQVGKGTGRVGAFLRREQTNTKPESVLIFPNSFHTVPNNGAPNVHRNASSASQCDSIFGGFWTDGIVESFGRIPDREGPPRAGALTEKAGPIPRGNVGVGHAGGVADLATHSKTFSGSFSMDATPGSVGVLEYGPW